MTDYIALLLEEQEEREEQEVLELERGPVAIPAPGVEEEEETRTAPPGRMSGVDGTMELGAADSGQSPERALPAGAEELEGRPLGLGASPVWSDWDRDGGKAVDRGLTGAAAWKGWPPGPAAPRRAGQDGADWADRGVRASLAPVLPREQERRVVTVERRVEQTAGPEVTARRLDRVFQRDARRYDGGFRLL